MARIEEKIAEIADPALRKSIADEVAKLKKHTRFGLVFEEHQPEVVPIFGKRVKRGERVAKKTGNLSEIWRVISVKNEVAVCEQEKGGETEVSMRESFPIQQLVVVRSMGETIYPSLTPIDSVSNGDPLKPHHVLIEADNYHALQLLVFPYEGKVDCIYIDPPYNTGARDWKYNNDYVDKNDQWQHSKWLTFMAKRLKLAKRLLNPENGVLIVTIDEHEVNHLGMLLKREFPEARQQMVTIVNNGAGVSQGGFYRVEEYAFFCFLGGAKPAPSEDDYLSEQTIEPMTQYWFSLIRYGGVNALPSKRANLVYPIAINQNTLEIVAVGKSLKRRVEEGEVASATNDWLPGDETIDGHPVIWPFRGNGSMATWQMNEDTLIDLYKKGFVRIRHQKKGPGGNKFSISYVKSGHRTKVESGEIPTLGREDNDGPLILGQIPRNVVAKTVWRRAKHDAGKWGSRVLREILGDVAFDYAKSPYAVLDCLAAAVGNRPDALIVDFFSGSGTTLLATELLNSRDGGKRHCLLVTNNEVSVEKSNELELQKLQPGCHAWETHGVCRSVTWPRSKFTILGQRDDGVRLSGEYLTGKSIDREKTREFTQIGFIDPSTLLAMTESSDKKKNTIINLQKQLVKLINGLPQSLVNSPMDFIVSKDHKTSLLFNTDRADAWFEALDGQDHVTDFYIVTQSKKIFDMLKDQVTELLGHVILKEEGKRSMADGFAANLEYFRLDFLDPQEVQMGRQFSAILPILWMMAGARGARPDAPDAHAPWLLPKDCPFAVLMQETRFKEFVRHVERRTDLTHVFIVTNSQNTIYKLRHEWPELRVVQLYKDYLENFRINLSEKPTQ